MDARMTEAQCAQQMAFMARECANWSGEMLGPHATERYAAPVSQEIVARFTAEIRKRCDRLEKWAAGTLFDTAD